MTPAQLSRLAAAGQVRDALAGGGCRTAGCAGLERWIRAHGTDVSRGAGQPRAGVVYALAPVDETSTPPGSSSGTATSARSR